MTLTGDSGEYWISSRSVRSLIQWLHSRGLDRDLLAAHFELAADALNDVRHHFPGTLYAALLDFAANRLADPLCGFFSGAAAAPDRWGALDPTLNHCQTLEQALRWQRGYQALVSNLGEVSLTHGEGGLILQWHGDGAPSHHLAEENIASWVRFARWITCTRHAPKAVHHRHPATVTIGPMVEFYQCPVRFESSFDGVVFPRHVPELPVKAAGHTGTTIGLPEPEPRATELEQALARFVWATLPQGEVTAAEAARHLGLEVTALQQQLAARGRTLADIIDQQRQRLARHYLDRHPAPNLLELTFMLGFPGLQGLEQAYLDWTGTPLPGRPQP